VNRAGRVSCESKILTSRAPRTFSQAPRPAKQSDSLWRDV